VHSKGFRHGKGKMTYLNGDVYDGDWRFNMKSGKGRMDFINGDVYDGGWLNDMKQGKGKILYSGSSKSSSKLSGYYDGEWVADKQHGKGVARYDSVNGCDGWEYTSNWIDGNRIADIHKRGEIRIPAFDSNNITPVERSSYIFVIAC
jgi:MORN repeat